MLNNVIKMVTRVEDNKGKNAILFKDENGKISYLDKRAKYNIPEIGESRECWVVSDKGTYDFIRFNIGIFHNIKEFINSIPNVTKSELSNLDGDIIKFINQIKNNVNYNVNITLDNLHKIKLTFDKFGIVTEVDEFVYETIELLQYLFNTYNALGHHTTNTNVSVDSFGYADIIDESLEDKIIRLKKEFHAKDEFDLDLAMKIHHLEKELNDVGYVYITKFKKLINSLNVSDEYVCTIGSKNIVYNLRKTTTGIEYYGSPSGVFKVCSLSVNDNKDDCIEFIKSLISVYKLDLVLVKEEL